MVSKVRNVRLGVFSGGGCHHPNTSIFQVINSYRHKDGMFSYLMSYVKNRDFSTFTEREIHAELVCIEIVCTCSVHSMYTFAVIQVHFVYTLSKYSQCIHVCSIL